MNNRKNSIKINIYLYINDMEDFKTKDEILIHLVHLCYLAYDSEKKSVYIPNNEVNEIFKNCTEKNADWKKIKGNNKRFKKENLLEATWAKDVTSKLYGFKAEKKQ